MDCGNSLSERVEWIAATVQVSMTAADYHCLSLMGEVNGQISVAKPGTAAAICSLSLLPSSVLSELSLMAGQVI